MWQQNVCDLVVIIATMQYTWLKVTEQLRKNLCFQKFPIEMLFVICLRETENA